MSGRIANHIDYLFRGLIALYYDELMHSGTEISTLDDDNFKSLLNDNKDRIKRVINCEMDDLLEEFEKQYLEVKEFINSSQNQ